MWGQGVSQGSVEGGVSEISPETAGPQTPWEFESHSKTSGSH